MYISRLFSCIFIYKFIHSFPSPLWRLHHVLEHLQQPLCALVSSSTGQVHPQFPQTLVAYHLLTLQQLDYLAHHYHQMLPSTVKTGHYVIPMTPYTGQGANRNTYQETTFRTVYWSSWMRRAGK